MLTQTLILLAGLALVILGADWLVEGASTIARKLGLGEFVIGMTIVGIGTSLPELVVSFSGALKGNADIAIGNVVGSNIFNALLILGITSLIRPIAITDSNRKADIPLNIAVSILLILAGWHFTLFGLHGSLVGDGDILSRLDGGLFLLLFSGYMIWSFRNGKSGAEETRDVDGKAPRKLWVAALMVLGGLAGLVFGGDKFVDAASRIARDLGISDKFIAITILAGGTSMPELVTCVVAAAKNKGALALGNILGSNISNILLILGGSAMICPLSFASMKPVDVGVLLLSSIMLLVAAFTNKQKYGKSIDFIDGIAFLLLFAGYMAHLIVNL